MESTGLIEINSKLSNIFTRVGGMKIFDDIKLSKISTNMKEIDRATNTTGRSNTQFMSKNMTLFMLGRTPFSMLNQCLAQIEAKRQALKEAIFKLKKNQIKLKKYHIMLKKESDGKSSSSTKLIIEKLNVKIQEIECGINDSVLYVEGALKDIAQFQEIYNQIVKHNKMENWDELDFEKAESEHHIKQAFVQGLRDCIMTGQVNVGNLEYFENCGIHPLSASMEVKKYINDKMVNIQETDKIPELEEMEDWLNVMVKKYKNKSSERLERIGINPIDEWYIYKEGEV
jgi:hypothetical protein